MRFKIQSLKKLLSTLMVVFTLAACSETPDPIEGTHYKRLPESLNSSQFTPITEVFSLTCAHCRAMEEILPTLQAALEHDINKMHITFNQSAYVAAMFYYAAVDQVGGIPDHLFMQDLFAMMQMPAHTTQEQQEAAMIHAFESRGLISPIKYNQQQLAELSQKVDAIMQLSEQTQIQSVPAFIVRGKYQVISSAHDKKEQIANTINYLLEK